MRIYKSTSVQFIILIVLIGSGMLATNGLIRMVDMLSDGPQAAQQDDYYQNLVYKHGLVGEPESEIVRVLGKPSEVFSDEKDELKVTYEYQPYRVFTGASRFQVHCYAGRVVATQIGD